ncbi:hypothetical protein HMPREF1990_01813 [Porphyromonas gingivalis W4087]|nr:hypothetical protein HMPREF1990_01813 [Porphyromonas gingivalis W4087]
MISDYIIRFENDGGCPVERAASSFFCTRQATDSNHGSISQFRIDKAPCYRIDKILPSYRIPTDESFI